MDLEVISIVNSRIVSVVRIEVIVKYKTVHFQNKKTVNRTLGTYFCFDYYTCILDIRKVYFFIHLYNS